jgi:hypothetical protein
VCALATTSAIAACDSAMPDEHPVVALAAALPAVSPAAAARSCFLLPRKRDEALQVPRMGHVEEFPGRVERRLQPRRSASGASRRAHAAAPRPARR